MNSIPEKQFRCFASEQIYCEVDSKLVTLCKLKSFQKKQNQKISRDHKKVRNLHVINSSIAFVFIVVANGDFLSIDV